MGNRLIPPCSYQGGKQRLAKQIADILIEGNGSLTTKFYDLCCGSGAISLELINRGVKPENITMIDIGCYGQFWEAIAEAKFDLTEFRAELNKLPNKENIQFYLKELSSNLDSNKMVYQYLLLQAGSFGGKQIYIQNNKWKNTSFRNYWVPTETSNRRSPVNPMMPMPDVLYKRVENIVLRLHGKIHAKNEDIFEAVKRIKADSNICVYVDPPYASTTGYGNSFDVYDLIHEIKLKNIPLYISEGYAMRGAHSAYLLSTGRKKGNISGSVQKKPTEEWLNMY